MPDSVAEHGERTTSNAPPTARGNGALSSSDGYNNNNNGRLPGQKNLKLQFKNVSYTIKQNNAKLVKVLNDTCGEFQSGRLTAILGPSGAGKTSMLNVLSGFKASGVTGRFELNNVERNLLTFRKMSSYIPQEFAMLDLLTVQETIQVSTDLKLPMETSKADKNKIMDNVLQILNMEKNRHTLVRDLSGGERKRLSIGVELVTNPPVMFFDEPTSGLDSVASLQVVSYLRRLACDGRIIVCVVHQPSSRLIKLFDDAVVMSGGEVLYAGPLRDMIAHFEQEGFICPNYYNPADFVLEVGSQEHDDNIRALIQRNKLAKCSRKNSLIDERSAMLSLSDSHTSLEMNESNIEQPRGEHCLQTRVRPKAQVSVWRQLSVLTRRSVRSMSRNLIAVQMRLIMHIVVAVLLGIVFWNIGNDASKVLTNSSCIFFMVMFVFFGNSMPSVLLCPQDTAVFIREYLNGWYSMGAYYVSKIVADIPMQFLCPTFFIGIVYFMTGQPEDVGRFVMCWGILLLTGVVGHFIGLVFGSAFDLQLAIFLVPAIAIPFMIFSGFFIRIHEVNAYLRPLCDVSFFRYTMGGIVQAIYAYDRKELECNVEFCYFRSPLKFLKEMDMLNERYGYDILGVLMWILVLKVLFFLTLVARVKKAQ